MVQKIKMIFILDTQLISRYANYRKTGLQYMSEYENKARFSYPKNIQCGKINYSAQKGTVGRTDMGKWGNWLRHM